MAKLDEARDAILDAIIKAAKMDNPDGAGIRNLAGSYESLLADNRPRP